MTPKGLAQGSGRTKLQSTSPEMGGLGKEEVWVAMGQDFSLGCVTFKMPIRNLSEDGQVNLEFRGVVQPGTI